MPKSQETKERTALYGRQEEVGRAIIHGEFFLLDTVIVVGQESSSFWPPHFILKEVSDC